MVVFHPQQAGCRGGDFASTPTIDLSGMHIQYLYIRTCKNKGCAACAAGLNVMAAAALSQTTPQGVQTSDSAPAGAGTAYLHVPGPYNPAAALPPKVVKKILPLEFVKMSEPRADVWPEDPVLSDTITPPHHTARPPVIHIKTWLECSTRMAAVLVSRFP